VKEMGIEHRGQPHAVAAPHPGRGMMRSSSRKSNAVSLWLWNVEGGWTHFFLINYLNNYILFLIIKMIKLKF
jgi:hypothetical protein